MNENTFEGDLKNGTGKIEAAVGSLTRKPDIEASGSAKQVEGKAQDLIGTVQDAVSQAADKVSETAATVGDQARDAYGKATDRARDIAGHVDPFVNEQPYAALGIAAAVGLLIGLLLAGRGPKIVYVRPPQ